MKEALRYLQKSKADDKDERVASVMQRINLTERFVMARQLITSNAEQSLSICNEVLMSVPTDGQVRGAGGGRHGRLEGAGRGWRLGDRGGGMAGEAERSECAFAWQA